MSAHERVRVGVVGCGMVAQAEHLQNLLQLNSRFVIAALADPSRTVREAMAARYGVAQAHEDYSTLLSSGGLDAVVVSSPAATHAEIVIAALDAGLHVFVETIEVFLPADVDAGPASAKSFVCGDFAIQRARLGTLWI